MHGFTTRSKIAQIQGVYAADADRMHTDRDLRPLLVSHHGHRL
jgi:hypothetical protein